VAAYLTARFWPAGPGGGPAPPAEKLRVRLGWLVNANSAGPVVAAARGFYRDEELVVMLSEGGMAQHAVRSVAAGEEDLGFANGPDLVISARAAGVPIKIAAVIHREGYHGFFVKDNSDIRAPRDWPGKRVGVKPGSPTYTYYLALASKLGIDRNTVREVPLGYDPRPFLAGDIDVYPGAKTNEAVTFEQQGIRVRCIDPEDYGIPTIGTVLFASEPTLRCRSDAVRRFVQATMRGWDWCRPAGNREEVVSHLAALNPGLDRRKELRALELTLPLVGTGEIDRARLAAFIDVQTRHGDLSRPVTIDELVTPPLGH
jgi:ABC-type nitrate/sulfonate/bicarbonate transport system substrate-binding protein